MPPQMSHAEAPTDLRELFYRWASRYTPLDRERRRIVDRSLQIAAYHDKLLDARSLKLALFSIVHDVARQEILGQRKSKAGKIRIGISYSQMLKGKRVLIAEDDYLQASDAASTMRQNGADVVGLFPRAKEALLYLKYDKVDTAILDVHLAEGTCFAIAEALKAANTPFVFLTGYEKDTIPAEFADVPHHMKPCPPEDLVSIMA